MYICIYRCVSEKLFGIWDNRNHIEYGIIKIFNGAIGGSRGDLPCELFCSAIIRPSPCRSVIFPHAFVCKCMRE